MSRHPKLTHLGDITHDIGQWVITIAAVFAGSALTVAVLWTFIQLYLLNH